VSNVDGSHIAEVLKRVDAQTTLFLVASKTFTTQETMANAHSARAWFLGHAKDEKHIAKHFVALSTNAKEVAKFGIATDNMFVFWDWVGGRYSLWSSIGCPSRSASASTTSARCSKARTRWTSTFRTAPLDKNLPVTLALLGVWYNNFFGAETHAILPYDQYLSRFPPISSRATWSRTASA
jgi:glucose-6-phosphate isomerase